MCPRWTCRRPGGRRSVAFAINFFLGNELGVAVEFLVGKVACRRASVVEDVKVEFPIVLAEAGAAPDDLLELGHGADDANEHDVLNHRCIDTGAEELGRGEDDGGFGFEFLETTEMSLADGLFV